MAGEDLLASWNDTPTRQAIVDYVASVTGDGPDHVPPSDRVATFDNDGTLWCEKPMPIQLAFILEQLAAMAERDESLRSRQPWKAAHERDVAWLSGVITKHYAGDDADVRVLLGGVLASLAGVTVDEYGDQAHRFVHDRTHPANGRRYLHCGYRPMVELLRYLEANDFVTFIASGGDRDFMRPIADEMYGIPPERVIGSSNAAALRRRRRHAELPRRTRRLRRRAGEADPDLEPHRAPTAGRRWQLERRHPDAALRRRWQPGAAAARPPRRRRAGVRLHQRRRDRAAAGSRRRVDGRQHQGRLVDGVRRPADMSRLPAVPVIAWRHGYERAWLSKDVVSGVAAGAVVIPQAMAYATIANLPTEVGLYTCMVPMAVYALLGGSRTLSVSTTSTIAILTASTPPRRRGRRGRRRSGTGGLPRSRCSSAGSCSPPGCCGSARSSTTSPTPPSPGSRSASGLTVAAGQLPNLLGVAGDPTADNFFADLRAVVDHLDDVSWATVAFSAGTLAVLFGLRRVAPSVPAPLVAVIGGILLVAVASHRRARHRPDRPGPVRPPHPRRPDRRTTCST